MLFIINFFAAMQDRLDTAKERGATATEYVMLIVGIAIILGAGAALFGGALSTWFSGLGSKIGIK